MHSYKQAFRDLQKQLQSLYEPGEATAIARILLEELTGISYLQSLSGNDALSTSLLQAIQRAGAALQAGRPLQYVLGYAWFLGRRFLVNDDVLIPRPETEELVQWITDDWQTDNDDMALLDIGAGSGCIPVCLKLALPHAAVTSCDISGRALQVAAQNAAANGAAIQWLELDFLRADGQEQLGSYDVIVSNPPYIPAAERETLHQNVRDFEPAIALFVPDDDALLFYRAIARFGQKHLRDGGAVYCELHEHYGPATQALFEAAGYREVVLRRDINGHCRMLKAVL